MEAIEISAVRKAAPKYKGDCPDYYRRMGIEVHDIEQAWNLDRYTGPAIEYILRSQYKENELLDLKKAVRKLERKIKEMEEQEKEA